ncbi:hypothetical protein CBR_g30310 [Chara braunii]|uniref:CCHC-type domain-containing protein n=1 Tax=Chara braunii TaxID=69332 RepID=A0A388JX39_CHABU|nr:hypothetical protein CBR_g30310 [Chara braunii]|eukprot:GBG62356.1 hypothetical protein CBR_g30310 [Chara braunii]
MSDRREHSRRDHRSSSEDRSGYRSNDRGYERERAYRRSPPRCFSCNERGHYANQCPNRSRPSTSFEVRRGRSTSPTTREGTDKAQEAVVLQRQIEELNKSLASVSEFVLAEKTKRGEEERLRQVAEEEQQRIRNEKELHEKKERKLRAKLHKEAERDAEMEKKMEMQLAARTGDFFNKMEESLGPVLEFARKAKGKKKIRVLSDDETSARSSGSETEKLHKKAGKLTISEKRKRGPEPVFEDSPPTITPSKRTPCTKAKEGVAVGRITRSRSKIKTKLSPLIAKQKSPGGSEVLAKLRFRNQAIDEIRGLDAQELQLIYKNEGVNYNGKIKAIFDIASHRTRVAFGKIEGTAMSESGECEEEDSAMVDVEEPDCDA